MWSSRSSSPWSSSMRQTCSAYSGLPPMRPSRVVWAPSRATARPSRAAIRRVVSTSDRGASVTVVARSDGPRPQSGSWSNSSGRVVVTTSRGTPLASSARCRTKASRASSAQCRSSRTTTSGRLAATASRNRRQAVKVSACSGVPVLASMSLAWPSSGARRVSSHWRSAGSSTTAATVSASLAATVAGSSNSRMPAWALRTSPRAQKLMPSPYGRQWPSRQEISSGWASTNSRSSRTSRLLPTPGSPLTVTTRTEASSRALA